jgi:hypothetical protein
MYQIIALVSLMFLTWGAAIWATYSSEESESSYPSKTPVRNAA